MQGVVVLSMYLLSAMIYLPKGVILMMDLKCKILAAAKKRFSRFGFQKTTVDELCRDCRISKKTFYQHFPSKNELFQNLLIGELKQVRTTLRAQVQDNRLPFHQLTQLLQAMIVYWHDDPFMISITKDNEALLPVSKVSTDYRELIEKEMIPLIGDIIRNGKKLNSFRDIDETFLSSLILKLAQTVIPSKLIDPAPPPSRLLCDYAHGPTDQRYCKK